MSFHTAYQRRKNLFSGAPSRTALMADTYKRNSELVSMVLLAIRYRAPSKKQAVYEEPQRKGCIVPLYFQEVC